MATIKWIIYPFSPRAKRDTPWEKYDLQRGWNLVGRMQTADIAIPAMNCSRNHGALMLRENTVSLYDRSTRGTFVQHYGVARTSFYNNNATLIVLKEGDWISFGGPGGTTYESWNDALWFRIAKNEPIEAGSNQLNWSDGERAQRFARTICATPTR